MAIHGENKDPCQWFCVFSSFCLQQWSSKFFVFFFPHQAFPPPDIKSAIVLQHNPWSPGECTEVFFISNTNTTDPIFCVKEMSKSILPAWLNQFPLERENLCFFYLQTVCQYFYCDISAMDLEGFFFPINQLDCSKVHVQGMSTSVNPSRTGFSIAVCASAYVRLVAVATSALLFHSGSRTCHIDSHWLCSTQCNRWHLVCVVSSRGCDDTVKFGVLSIVMPVVSVWSVCHSHWACWSLVKKG